jgi:hypothetical protein
MGRTDNANSAYSTKFSPELTRFGFTQVSNILIQCQGDLGLTDGELLTYIRLLSFWFSRESKIYPSQSLLAQMSKVSISTIANRLRSLQRKEYVRRTLRPGYTSIYDITPGLSTLYKFQKSYLGGGTITPLQKLRGLTEDTVGVVPQNIKDKKDEPGLIRTFKKTNPTNPKGLDSLEDVFKEFLE